MEKEKDSLREVINDLAKKEKEALLNKKVTAKTFEHARKQIEGGKALLSEKEVEDLHKIMDILQEHSNMSMASITAVIVSCLLDAPNLSTLMSVNKRQMVKAMLMDILEVTGDGFWV